MINYLKYFFYLLSNWNIRIATHIIRREIKGEKKYNINTTGADELNSLRKAGIDTSHSTIYMPVSYDILESILEKLSSMGCTQLTDIGCGKGRALCVAAHYGIKNLKGIDISKEFCDTAKNNLKNTAQIIPDIIYEIKNNDAFYYEISTDTQCVFLFNPFDEIIMSGVIKNILKSFKLKPRKLIIVYMNPLYEKQFLRAGFKKVYSEQKLEYIDGAIYVKE